MPDTATNPAAAMPQSPSSSAPMLNVNVGGGPGMGSRMPMMMGRRGPIGQPGGSPAARLDIKSVTGAGSGGAATPAGVAAAAQQYLGVDPTPKLATIRHSLLGPPRLSAIGEGGFNVDQKPMNLYGDDAWASLGRAVKSGAISPFAGGFIRACLESNQTPATIMELMKAASRVAPEIDAELSSVIKVGNPLGVAIAQGVKETARSAAKRGILPWMSRTAMPWLSKTVGPAVSGTGRFLGGAKTKAKNLVGLGAKAVPETQAELAAAMPKYKVTSKLRPKVSPAPGGPAGPVAGDIAGGAADDIAAAVPKPGWGRGIGRSLVGGVGGEVTGYGLDEGIDRYAPQSVRDAIPKGYLPHILGLTGVGAGGLPTRAVRRFVAGAPFGGAALYGAANTEAAGSLAESAVSSARGAKDWLTGVKKPETLANQGTADQGPDSRAVAQALSERGPGVAEATTGEAAVADAAEKERQRVENAATTGNQSLPVADRVTAARASGQPTDMSQIYAAKTKLQEDLANGAITTQQEYETRKAEIDAAEAKLHATSRGAPGMDRGTAAGGKPKGTGTGKSVASTDGFAGILNGFMAMPPHQQAMILGLVMSLMGGAFGGGQGAAVGGGLGLLLPLMYGIYKSQQTDTAAAAPDAAETAMANPYGSPRDQAAAPGRGLMLPGMAGGRPQQMTA